MSSSVQNGTVRTIALPDKVLVSLPRPKAEKARAKPTLEKVAKVFVVKAKARARASFARVLALDARLKAKALERKALVRTEASLCWKTALPQPAMDRKVFPVLHCGKMSRIGGTMTNNISSGSILPSPPILGVFPRVENL